MSSERAFVYQLIEGYAIQDDVGFKATGSVTLIRDGPLRILVDCGDPWNGGELINKLMQRETTCSEVTHVVVTHGHVDHCGNLSLFKNAQVFMSYDFVGPDGIYGSIDKEKGYAISENVRVEVMKGHTAVDLIVRVKNTVHGTVIVAGDLFEREHDGSSWEQLSEYPEEQKQSRQRILDEADVIVPGHGPLFHVEK